MNLRISLLAVVVLGCAAQTAQVASSQPVECASPAGAERLLTPGSTIFVGEIHGTKEVPASVGGLACAALQAGLPVRVGLELFVEDQAALDAFLASEGGAAAKAKLLKAGFWTREYQDGRSSKAMLSLLEQLRALRAGGKNLEVFAFDSATPSSTRDADMAKRALATLQRAHAGVTLLLAGNLHARKTRGGFMPDFEPMGYHLVQAGQKLTSLNAMHSGGTAWVCFGLDADACRVNPLTPRPDNAGGKLDLTAIQGGAYDGTLKLGLATASAPAAVKVAAERLTVPPDHPSVLRSEANAAYERKDFAACAASYAKVLAQPGAMPPDAYNAACCAAKAGKTDDAFAYLKRAVAMGAKPDAQWDQDEDLASLWSDPRWAELRAAK